MTLTANKYGIKTAGTIDVGNGTIFVIKVKNITKGKIVAAIPARAGSKRIKNKNLINIKGKPLIDHTISFVDLLDELDLGVISTDDVNIQKRSSAKVLAPFLRPASISGDNSTDSEWLYHLLSWFEDNMKGVPEFVLLMRPTSPLRSAHNVRNAIKMALKSKSAVRSVTKIPRKMHPRWSIEHSGQHFAPVFQNGFATRSQDLGDTYFPNGLYDIIYVPQFLKTGALYGKEFLIAIEPIEVINDLDIPEDVETLIKNWKNIQRINDKTEVSQSNIDRPDLKFL